MFIFSFLLFHIQCLPYYFVYKWGDKSFGFLVGQHKRGCNFQRGRVGVQTKMKLWYKCKEVLINQVFYSTHKQNIKKTKETITPIVDTKRLTGTIQNVIQK